MPKLSVRKAPFCAIKLLLFFCIFVSFYAFANSEDKGAVLRTIRYSFTLSNTTGQAVPKAQVWLYGPVKENSTQKVIEIKASYPYELIVDDKGNQVLYFSLADISPYMDKIITIEAKLLLSKKNKNDKLKDSKIYLKPEKYIESDNPEIALISKVLKVANPIKTSENIFKWITKNIKDAGYTLKDRGALYAFKNKAGDCTEQAYLFAALCRANNIPARVIGGYVCANNKALRPEEYHNWAEFYNNGKWLIADPQKKVFMGKQSDYIAMEIISESNNNPMQKSHRFRLEGEGLKVRMND